MTTRRQFCLSTAAALALPPLARNAFARRQVADALKIETLREGAHAITGQGGNALLIETTDGSILIDAKVMGAGIALSDLIQNRFGSPPKTLINTHHHADHTGGNFAFADTTAIIAHRNVKPRLEANINERWRPELARQARQLSRSGKIDQAEALASRAESISIDQFDADVNISDTHTVNRGGRSINLRQFGNGHTDNDLIAHLHDTDILHMGDLLFHEVHPFIDRPAGASVALWIKRLEEAYALCTKKTIVIPGHGEITDRTALPKMKTYFEQLREIVQAAIDAGSSRDAIMKLTPEQFTSRGFEQLQPRALGAMYDELTGASIS